MSIIRNSANSYNLKIARFGTDGEVPYTDNDGIVHYHDKDDEHPYYATTYGTFDGCGFQLIGTAAENGTLIMRVYLPDNSNGSHDGLLHGYINALTPSSIRMIEVSGNNLIYYAGSISPVKTQTFTEGWHIIGFVRNRLENEDGVVCYYDGVIESTSITHRCYGSNVIGCAIVVQGGSSTPVGITGVRCSKVIAEEMIPNTRQRIFCHYYPCQTSKPSGTEVAGCSWYETRVKQGLAQNIQISVSFSPKTSGIATSYGISLDDLREIFGSGYDNLLAILTEDGGVNTRLGFKESTSLAPYEVTKMIGGQSVTRDFAFDLSGVWVLDAYEPSRPTGGYLRQGRKPKWDIFHDVTYLGWGVDADADQSSAEGYMLNYNVSRRVNMNAATHDSQPYLSEPIHLEDFDGYDDSGNNIRIPEVIVGTDDGYGVVFTDGIPIACDDSNALLKGAATTNKRYAVYVGTDIVNAKIGAKLGNVAPWHIPAALLYYTGLTFAGFEMRAGDGRVTFIEGSHLLTAEEQQQMGTAKFFSADTPATIRQRYRDTIQYVDAKLNQNTAAYLLRRLILNNPVKVDGKTAFTSVYKGVESRLVLLSSTALVNPSAITRNDRISLDLVRSGNAASDIHGELRYERDMVVDFSKATTPLALLHRYGNGYSDSLKEKLTYADTVGVGNVDGVIQISVMAWDTQKSMPVVDDASIRAKRFFGKLECWVCNDISDTNPIPLKPRNYACEMVLSRTNAEAGNDTYPYPNYDYDGMYLPYWHAWKYWNGSQRVSYSMNEDDAGYVVTDYNKYFAVRYADLGLFQYSPATFDTDDNIPKNTMFRWTFYDADSAPMVTMFKALYEPDNMVAEGALMYRNAIIRSLYGNYDCTDTDDGGYVSLAAYKPNEYGTYVQADLLDILDLAEVGTSYYGIQFNVERIWYETEIIGGKAVVRRKTEQGSVRFITLDISGRSLDVTLDGDGTSSSVTLYLSDSVDIRGGKWIEPSGNTTDNITGTKIFIQPYDGLSNHRGDVYHLSISEYEL